MTWVPASLDGGVAIVGEVVGKVEEGALGVTGVLGGGLSPCSSKLLVT